MQANIKYPESARKAGEEGRVFVSYVVEKDGRISNVSVLRGFDKDCDAEAVRVIKNMPNWEPGQQRGKAVRVQYNMPIVFSLGKEKEVDKDTDKDAPPPPPKSKKEVKQGDVRTPPPPPKTEKK